MSHVQASLEELHAELGKAIERRALVLAARRGEGPETADTMGRSVINLNNVVEKLAGAIAQMAVAASEAARGGVLV